MLQVGAGYLTNPTFVAMYLSHGDKLFWSVEFWGAFKVPLLQALFKKDYLYRILMSACVNLQHKTILKYEEPKNGILEWHEFKMDYDNDGSKALH